MGLDPPSLCDAQSTNNFSPWQKTDLHYQELAPGTTSGQWEYTKLQYNQISFEIC